MQWVWEELSFRGRPFQVAHFEAPGSGSEPREDLDDDLVVKLDRCEAELGACLWHDTNKATLRFLEERHTGYMGLRVLELGAGAGACGIALALDGADSLVTDFEALVPLLELNCAKNGFGTCQNDEDNQMSAPAARARRPRKTATRRRGAADRDEESSGDDNRHPKQVQEPIDSQKKLTAKERKAARVARKANQAPSQVEGGLIRPAEQNEHLAIVVPEDLEDEKPSSLRKLAQELGFTDEDLEKPDEAETLEEKKTLLIEMIKAKVASSAETEASGEKNVPSPPVVSRCRAQAVDWVAEASVPSLPEEPFDIVVICDCLYENKDSWDALECILHRLLPRNSASNPELVLASATLRRPFLEEFIQRLLGDGFASAKEVVSEHASVVALTRCHEKFE